MLLFLRLLVALGVIGGISKLFSGNGSSPITKKSNCQDAFLSYGSNLDIPKSKLKKLKRARKTIQAILKDYFREQKNFTIPKFALQGSFGCGTMIRTVKDLCDFDMGIYFFSEPKCTYETIQRHIQKALVGHTLAGVQLKSKCVRINYQGDFHIDMPMYYTTDRKNYFLGSKGNNWEICDSKYFKDWVISNTSDSPQIIRIIRYYKAWSDYTRFMKGIKMPSGLVFTIWAIQFYKSDSRDDIAFTYTSAEILKYLKDNFKNDWKCEMPVEPHDNVLDKLSKQQKSNFYSALKELVQFGFEALTSESKEESEKIWKKQFGKRF